MILHCIIWGVRANCKKQVDRANALVITMMGIIGTLSDVSLPEIFQLIEKGKRTGLLTVRALPPATGTYYLWVKQGHIIAAANRQDGQGLISLISKCQLVSDRVLSKLVQWCCPVNQPLGVCLKQQGVLTRLNLEQLFQIQLLQQLSVLFQLQDGSFRFDSLAVIPTQEMTGLSIPATEATLMGLRVLAHWDNLAAKLPDPNQNLLRKIAGYPAYQLDTLEWQIWQYSKGAVSLHTIAQNLKFPVEQVQHIAFRLISMGLAEVIP
ncbi:DUF4388 domain-containing protein [Coleofasciculus sp. F4-SAH-05]|uniref:DUF4388 domain-containing protein n=1 Tax=Coleofasciculus TaxID=669368 RepID=UPI0032F2103A